MPGTWHILSKCYLQLFFTYFVVKWLDFIARDRCVFIEKKLDLTDTLVPLCLSSSGTGKKEAPNILENKGKYPQVYQLFTGSLLKTSYLNTFNSQSIISGSISKLQIIDTTCQSLRDCLDLHRAWSNWKPCSQPSSSCSSSHTIFLLFVREVRFLFIGFTFGKTTPKDCTYTSPEWTESWQYS